MFHIAKDTLLVVDAFWLTEIRCSLASLFFIPFLIWSEGHAALRFGKHNVATWWYGTGFAVFNYFLFTGLSHSPLRHGAIIMALMPLISALVNWISDRQRPPTYTLISIAIALTGVLLVISRGWCRNIVGH
jgi:drug/metabolite transporter (DMT)-like permease